MNTLIDPDLLEDIRNIAYEKRLVESELRDYLKAIGFLNPLSSFINRYTFNKIYS